MKRSDVENTGRWLMSGALHEIVRLALIMSVTWFVLTALAAIFSDRDDSDAPHGSRSGLIISRDALTGCEYITTRQGAVTPRRWADGKQVCR